jgi:hypothetical protein
VGIKQRKGKTKLQVVSLQHQHMVCRTKDPTYRSEEGEEVCLQGRAKPPKKLGAGTEVRTREMLCRDNQLLTPNPGGLLLAPRRPSDLVSRTKLDFSVHKDNTTYLYMQASVFRRPAFNAQT